MLPIVGRDYWRFGLLRSWALFQVMLCVSYARTTTRSRRADVGHRRRP